jgi:polyhydroxyalkanoate synthesis regulator phasin
MEYTKDYTAMAQQMSGAYKSAMDNGIHAMTMIQENAEKMIGLSLEKTPWFPEEGKKFVNAWMKACRKGSDDLKSAADEQYKKFEAFVNPQKKA